MRIRGEYIDILAGAFLGLVLILAAAGLIYFITWATSAGYENIRRQTFEQSRAFQEGTVRSLDRLCIEYESSTGTARATIAAAIQHQTSDIPSNLLPPCARSLKGY